MKTIFRLILALSVLAAAVSCGEKDKGPAVSEKIVAEINGYFEPEGIMNKKQN